jgi:2-dehydropantoate 2-reductase
MRILVVGAGVIGSVYAGRLAAAGHEVAVLARGERLAALRRRGIALEDVAGGRSLSVRTALLDRLDPDGRYDLALVPVRREQLDSVLPVLASAPAIPSVLLFGNYAGALEGAAGALGRTRVLAGFPGAGGTFRGDVARYLLVRQQPTTLGELDGAPGPRLRAIATALRGAGFRVAASRRIGAWLETHAAFIVPLAAAVRLAGGSAAALAERPADVRLMVEATREAFAALAAIGRLEAAANLRVLYRRMPAWFAVRYWRRALRTPLGEIAIAAHAGAAHDEMTDLARELGRLVDQAGESAPALRRLVAAGL